MNSLSLPVVHPDFQKLKRSGRSLHLAAAGFILLHALTHAFSHHANYFYLGCLLLVALDILILVFAGSNILKSMPKVNLFFRLVEFFFFLGIGINMILESSWIFGIVHILLSAAYFYLFYLEKQLLTEEYVALQPLRGQYSRSAGAEILYLDQYQRHKCPLRQHYCTNFFQ